MKLIRDHFSLIIIAVVAVVALTEYFVLSLVGANEGTTVLAAAVTGLVGGLLGGWQGSKPS